MSTLSEICTGDILELCLDLCSPTTLAALYTDHQNYIAQHQATNSEELWGHMDMIQQDADLIFAHLSDTHFEGDNHKASSFINKYEPTHIPF